MSTWLLKTDPRTYSVADFERDKSTTWDGVRNNQALIYIRLMKKGDQAFIYHSGDDKSIVGLAEVTSAAYADPQLKDPKRVVVDLKFKKRAANPITLAQVKADRDFAELLLVRNSRLSVMPVPEAMWNKLLTMGGL